MYLESSYSLLYANWKTEKQISKMFYYSALNLQLYDNLVMMRLKEMRTCWIVRLI